jgi:3-dehydro-L-gulonate 2-dehydrogenase
MVLLHLSYDQLKAEFLRVLNADGVPPAKAEECATLFADTTLVGVYSHGVNRFPRFIRQLRAGHIQPAAVPERLLALGAVEQWDAHRGIGNVTAKAMMDRAINLASGHGIGLVALRNANHWMRGGTYGQYAAERGYVGICWSNGVAVMPPWGAKECRLGTNPLSIAVPGTPITMVDMSCSLFSYGKLEVTRLAGQSTPFDAGYDENGALTRDPAAVEKTRRLLPMGFWKGSGLSIVLDMIAALLSGGLSVADISQDQDDEYNVSQVFIAIEVDRLIDGPTREAKLKRIRDYVLSAERADPDRAIRLPGHQFAKTISENTENGIPVDESVWAAIRQL